MDHSFHQTTDKDACDPAICGFGEVDADGYAQVGGWGWGGREGYAEAGGVLREAKGFVVAAEETDVYWLARLLQAVGG